MSKNPPPDGRVQNAVCCAKFPLKKLALPGITGQQEGGASVGKGRKVGLQTVRKEGDLYAFIASSSSLVLETESPQAY